MKMESDFLTEEDLYERGWTEERVESGLLVPYQQIPRKFGANVRPVLVFTLEDVEEVEWMLSVGAELEAAELERDQLDPERDIDRRRIAERFLELCTRCPRPSASDAELERSLLFLEWWLAQMAQAPGLEARESARRRARLRRNPR